MSPGAVLAWALAPWASALMVALAGASWPWVLAAFLGVTLLAAIVVGRS